MGITMWRNLNQYKVERLNNCRRQLRSGQPVRWEIGLFRFALLYFNTSWQELGRNLSKQHWNVLASAFADYACGHQRRERFSHQLVLCECGNLHISGRRCWPGPDPTFIERMICRPPTQPSFRVLT